MYTTRIDEEHRAAILLLCDRSGSMAEETSLDGLPMTRAEAVASLINQLLDELLGRLRRSDRVRDCLDLALLEYSGEGVLNLLDDGGGFVTVSELIRRPVTVRPRHVLRRLPSGNQVAATIPQRQWIEAKAIGNTPMKAAFEEPLLVRRRPQPGQLSADRHQHYGRRGIGRRRRRADPRRRTAARRSHPGRRPAAVQRPPGLRRGEPGRDAAFSLGTRPVARPSPCPPAVRPLQHAAALLRHSDPRRTSACSAAFPRRRLQLPNQYAVCRADRRHDRAAML